ncbi:uncharacterized protein G2W53_032496 [Senna tora]|uniref:Uncharacterized protein n=1 Tax=Senna tora TaxID=362788 RepID=A0A834W6D1_9FABA|nr:uncharacterized protein G2W53_032496 [Senna tora]
MAMLERGNDSVAVYSTKIEEALGRSSLLEA